MQSKRAPGPGTETVESIATRSTAAISPLWRLLVVLLCVGMISVAGCGGCQTDDGKTRAEREAEAKKKLEELKKKKKKKPDFETPQVEVRPGLPGERPKPVKPGHWISAVQELKTNNFDFVGGLEAGVVDKDGRPIYLERTPFRLTTTRPANLPKGQVKRLEIPLFVPHASQYARVSTNLRGPGGHVLPPSMSIFPTMPPYQYHFVVLAREPSRYGYLQVLDSIRAPFSDESLTSTSPHYLVELIEPTARPPLPSHVLTWTTIAYLLWDDVSPETLTPEQKSALVDWVHWGGQLIISGPDSLDSLRTSFLGPYLPAQNGGKRDLNAADWKALDDHWTALGKDGQPVGRLQSSKAWSGVKLEPHADASPIPRTGELVWERPVGRGRIVVTVFRLTERALQGWSGFDGFVNACLLRRPPREFFESFSIDSSVSVVWADEAVKGDRRDAGLTSKLRIFARDAGTKTLYERTARDVTDVWGQVTQETFWRDPDRRGGVGAWNDFSPVANAARESLREAAGIRVPKATFVVWVLGIYLLMLVPLNWLVFRLIRRVEWAWIAAPVIALICAGMVIRYAQLDIGFARAQTEVAILEVQGSYPRAHLSRYTALYTSLSTTYQLEFDELSAVAQPFPDEDFRMVKGQSRSTVTYERQSKVRLNGFGVMSNTTDMVHSEQMVDLGGLLHLDMADEQPKSVMNETSLPLTDVVVLWRSEHSELTQGAWIGSLPVGEAATLEFRQLGPDLTVTDLWDDEYADADATTTSDKLELSRVTSVVHDHIRLKAGEVCLVGRHDGVLGGLAVRPAARQVRGATVVVAHLRPAAMLEPRRDVNSRAHVKPLPDSPI